MASSCDLSYVALMWIERLFPEVIAGKAGLEERLVAEAIARGFDAESAIALAPITPANLLAAECFLDKMTGLWRYEFGFPYHLDGELVWGTHMWVPVGCLVSALSCVKDRLLGD